jgi:hypothetical protein
VLKCTTIIAFDQHAAEPKLVRRQDRPAYAAAPLRRGILRLHS